MYVIIKSAESFANLQCYQEYNYPIDSKKRDFTESILLN